MGLSESTDFIGRRYDRLAPAYRVVEFAFGLPPGLRNRSVAHLALAPGDRVLEIGCGTGRNFRLLVDAVGPSGTVEGIDISDGMLERAGALAERRGWTNVSTGKEDAAALTTREPLLHGVLFSLSYSVIPNRNEALRRAWETVLPGGRIVIMDAGAFGWAGRVSRRSARALSRRTVLGDPDIKPWEELRKFEPDATHELAGLGAYCVAVATKPRMAVGEPSPRISH